MPVPPDEMDGPDPMDEALDKEGLTHEKYAKSLKALVNAKQQKVFMPAGAKRPVYSAHMTDNKTRLAAIQELRAVRGWGKAPPPRQTLLNGEGFSITINLESHQQANDQG